MNLHPVILSGGAGTRLWPVSRTSRPKQFLPLLKGVSPFQAALARVQQLAGVCPSLIVANEEHRFLVLDQLRTAGAPPASLYLEPFGRNTAPAAAIAAFSLLREDPAALMLVLPADHDIADDAAFCQAVARGVPAAEAGRLVVFGIEASSPETGYGYIERGAPLDLADGCYHVSSFIEKPELEIARRLIASGRHYWNSGIFLFGAARFVEELTRLQPELAGICRAAAEAVTEDHGCRRISAASIEHCSAISIDYAVFEHTDAAAVVPATFRWSDIGSWNALWASTDKDARGNATQGDVHVQNVGGSYLYASGRMVVAIGVQDLVIVETPDALLVANRAEAQQVREAVEQLRLQGRPECRVHRIVHRPWGSYEDVDSGHRFRVKRLTVHPGAQLSLQLHHHRAEHWVVVSGTARITRGDETTLLTENQSAYIPVGVTHRLANPGRIPLQIVEVQTGAYLDEDDIVRLEDAYHRTCEGVPA